MAKYIVDIDSMIQCCEFLSIGKMNGEHWTYVQNVKAFIDRFPKDKVEETIEVDITRKIK